MTLTATGVVVTGKVALVCPAATVTALATTAAPRLLDKVTTVPPAGAALLKVTVPVAPVPPTTAAGLTARLNKDTDDAGVSVPRKG